MTLIQGNAVVKNPPANARDIGDVVWSLDGEDPLKEEKEPTPVFLPGESHGQKSLVGYSPWSCKKLDMTEWLHFSPLMNLLQFLHMVFWGSGWSRFYLFHAFLDALLWNCLGLMAQWVCGGFTVELSGCGLSITESLCVSAGVLCSTQSVYFI